LVDLDPRLNAAIIKFVAEQNIQPGAFLFQSTSGRAMHLRTATARLKKHGIPGFHAFRRYRTTHMRDAVVPEDIIRFWLGHAGESVTDRYSKLAENEELRKKWTLRAGLGFSPDHLGKPGRPGPHIGQAVHLSKPTKPPNPPKKRNAAPAVAPGREPSGKNADAPAGSVEQDASFLAEGAVQNPPYTPGPDDLDPFFSTMPAPEPTQEALAAERARLAELRAILNGVS
jgi:hypothetical protein